MSRCPDKDDQNRKRNPSRLRVGKITTNPFLNFLREMRKTSKNMSVTQVVSKGAELWRKMDPQQKQPYHQLAKQARMSARSRKSGWKNRRRGHSRRTSRKRSRSRRSRSRKKSRH